MVLDEVDQIETSIKSTTDLYKIFEWPYLKNSKLILIGNLYMFLFKQEATINIITNIEFNKVLQTRSTSQIDSFLDSSSSLSLNQK